MQPLTSLHLFKSEDLIGYKEAVDHPARATPTDKCEFFIANPIKQVNIKLAGGLSNIAAYRNIVIEFDDGASEADQLKRMRSVPYLTAISSGNKSVHFIISVEDGFKDLEEYNYYARALYAVVGGAADPKCKNANRLTRMPGIMRASTGRVQELLREGEVLTKERLLYWLVNSPKARSKFARFQAEEVEQERLRQLRAEKVAADGPTPIPKIYADMIEAGVGHPDATSRHDSLVKLCAWLTHNGYTEEQLEDFVYKAADSLGIGARGDAAALIGYFSRQIK